jgi:hypothetical protein
MAQASAVPAADSRGEEFSFTMIVDDHDADVHDRDSMVRCIHQCSG